MHNISHDWNFVILLIPILSILLLLKFLVLFIGHVRKLLRYWREWRNFLHFGENNGSSFSLGSIRRVWFAGSSDKWYCYNKLEPQNYIKIKISILCDTRRAVLLEYMCVYIIWAFSPCFPSLGIPGSSLSSSVLRVLLIEPGDIRHVLFTIAHRRRYRRPDGSLIPIHFYLLENPLEVLGRNLMQLQLFCDNEMPIRQKANTFLEVFGNCKVQKRTSLYIESLGNRLKLLMKHMDSTSHNTATTTTSGKDKDKESMSDNILDDIVDLSLLRYRERDELENVFSNYSKSTVFKLDELLDQRFRWCVSSVRSCVFMYVCVSYIPMTFAVMYEYNNSGSGYLPIVHAYKVLCICIFSAYSTKKWKCLVVCMYVWVYVCVYVCIYMHRELCIIVIGYCVPWATYVHTKSCCADAYNMAIIILPSG